MEGWRADAGRMNGKWVMGGGGRTMMGVRIVDKSRMEGGGWEYGGRIMGRWRTEDGWWADDGKAGQGTVVTYMNGREGWMDSRGWMNGRGNGRVDRIGRWAGEWRIGEGWR